MALNLRAFLSSRRSVLQSLTNQPVFVVTGNEAADLDSCVSALTYSCFLQNINTSNTYLPLINIPRHEFPLRSEVTYIFKRLGLDSNDLFFRDDTALQLKQWHTAGRLRLVLTDHNILSLEHKPFSDCVVEIVDHHKDERLYQPQDRLVEMVGSCCTLVARKMLQHSAVDQESAMLLLGTIALDTVNFDADAKKVTPADVTEAQKLAPFAQVAADALYKDLMTVYFAPLKTKQHLTNGWFLCYDKAKFDTSSLNAMDLLRRDAKLFTATNTRTGITVRYVLSSIPMLTAEYIRTRDGWAQAMQQFSDEQQADFQGVTGVAFEPIRRDALYCSPNNTVDVAAVLACLGELQLSSPVVTAAKGVVHVDQLNTAASRKQLQPLLQSFFEGSLQKL
eukprot:TRINITY_DN3223_c0_g1_i2.p1 TRINITY_DN3223_c0_g1~~TRINITY_DN3223_c0_g1_i2.p1  ORF type:complete len:401 (-),score=90.30 TRINITY_DN3223_c0_g1_i2:16-1191(-)